MMAAKTGAYHRVQGARLALGALVALALASAAQAQPGDRDRRQQFVEGLLQSLIESQIDRRPPPRPDAGPPGPPRPAGPEMQEARQALAQFTTDSSRLIESLSAETGRTPSAADHLREAIRLNAAAASLSRRGGQVNDLGPLMDDARALDSQWRVLSHRIRRDPRVSGNVRTAASRLDTTSKRLGDVFRMEPQVDYQELGRHADALNTALRYLIEDIAVEIPRGPEQTRLAIEAGKTQRMAEEFAQAVSQRRPHGQLVEQFTLTADPWRRLASRLRPSEDRYLRRSVARIDELQRAIYERLWLSPPIDEEQLLQLTAALLRDVQRIFDSVTLGALIDLPGASSLVSSGGEFYGLCQNFERAVKDGEAQPELADAYQLIESAWPNLSRPLSRSASAEVRQALEQTERSLSALRETLQLRPAFDRRAALEIGAAINTLAEQLRSDLRRQVAANTAYDSQVRNAAERRSAEFKQVAEHFHESAAKGADEEHLRRHSVEIADAWRSLQTECLQRLRPQERVRYSAINAKLTPLVVDLQALFAR